MQIAQCLSERGFAVLRYDKRRIGANFTINQNVWGNTTINQNVWGNTTINQNVWGNTTINDVIHDAEKALNVLIQQPEADPKRISIIGHSEGTVIAPRVAIDNSTKVKNIILMGTVAQTERQLLYFQVVSLPLLYAEKVLDHNHDGLISIQQIAKAPLLTELLVPSSVIIKSLLTNNTMPYPVFLEVALMFYSLGQR